MISVAQLKQTLTDNPERALRIVFQDGAIMPAHFHITEVGHVTKDFVDCGGTRRSTSACVLQTLVAHDVDHRLRSDKLAKIMGLTGTVIPDDSLPVELEVDQGTISLFALAALQVTDDGVDFLVAAKHTACLAPDKCGLDDPPASADNKPEAACDPAANC